MDKDAILGFIRKNVVSLSCGVVALLAVAAYFYPLGGMQDALKTQADQDAGLYGALTSLIKPRKMPLLDLDKTEPASLPNFPNEAAITKGHAAIKTWGDYSIATVNRLVELNAKPHPVLLEHVLPTVSYEPDYYNFAKLYRMVLSTDPTITGTGDPKAAAATNPDAPLLFSNHDLNLQNDILHGGVPPTPKNIEDAQAALWANTFQPQIQELNGQPINLVEIQAAYTIEALKLPLSLKKKAAHDLKVYVDADAFNADTKIVPTDKPSFDQIWYSQMQVWIEQDVARAIAEANANASSVLDAPVKRLVSIQVPAGPAMYTLQPVASGTGGQPAPPANPNAKDDAPIVPNYAASVTGRYCNPMYDVVQFTMYVDVDASQVNQFIETLSNGRMMTVIAQNQWALSSEAESAKGFLYGQSSTVRLQLTVESLFFRAWTLKLMPENVKSYIGAIPPVAGGIGQPMGGGAQGYPPGGGGMGGGMMRPPTIAH